MPTRRHFFSRHALQAVRFFLLIVHSPLFLQSVIDERLLYDLPKNDWKMKMERLTLVYVAGKIFYIYIVLKLFVIEDLLILFWNLYSILNLGYVIYFMSYSECSH